jgi:hypothetical protein
MYVNKHTYSLHFFSNQVMHMCSLSNVLLSQTKGREVGGGGVQLKCVFALVLVFAVI